MSSVIEKTNSFRIDYPINVKNRNDIIADLEIEDDEEKLMFDSIINGIEKTAGKYIANNKCVNLPFIGCLRKNPLRLALNKKKRNFSAIRKAVTKSQYKIYVSEVVTDIKKANEAKDKFKSKLFKLKIWHNKVYNKYAQRFGKAYADMYIYSLHLMKDVEFDAEWEEHYQSLIKSINN